MRGIESQKLKVLDGFIDESQFQACAEELTVKFTQLRDPTVKAARENIAFHEERKTYFQNIIMTLICIHALLMPIRRSLMFLPKDTQEVKMDKKPRHTFELSGLGSAPFTIVKAEPGNPTFFCEHCGTMLKNRYFVKSAEGRVSVVGVDCLKKTGDIGLLEGIKRQKSMDKARKREKEHQARQQNERQMYGGLTWEERRQQLKADWDNSLGDLRDWVEEQEVYESACSTNFGADVMGSVCNGDKVTDNAVKILVEIRAKQTSKSRKNSRAYKEKHPEAQAEWGDFFAQYNIKCVEVDSYKEAYLDHHRF